MPTTTYDNDSPDSPMAQVINSPTSTDSSPSSINRSMSIDSPVSAPLSPPLLARCQSDSHILDHISDFMNKYSFTYEDMEEMLSPISGESGTVKLADENDEDKYESTLKEFEETQSLLTGNDDEEDEDYEVDDNFKIFYEKQRIIGKEMRRQVNRFFTAYEKTLIENEVGQNPEQRKNNKSNLFPFNEMRCTSKTIQRDDKANLSTVNLTRAKSTP